MSFQRLYLLLLLSFTLLLPLPASGQENQDSEPIRQLLEATDPSEPLTIHRIHLRATPLLREFYRQRAFQPAWVDTNGAPQGSAQLLLAAIKEADADGLSPRDYHLESILVLSSLLAAHPSPGLAAELDLLLTDAFLLLGYHLLHGRVDQESGAPQWQVEHSQAKLSLALHAAAAPDGNPQAILTGLLPQQAGYRELRATLADYRRLAEQGGWPQVPGSTTLRLGDRDHRVVTLRQRLHRSRDLSGTAARGDVFDETLEAAVRSFQQRHGLLADGVVGRQTLAALNVPLEVRIRQLKLNLERWRWLAEEFGRRHILVNTAANKLELIEDEQAILSMRVVTGTPYRRTPNFSDRVTYLVLNPYWNIPASIAAQDILPELQENPDYLAQNGIKVLDGWNADSATVTPDTVDWERLRTRPQAFPYRLRQDPGPRNPLGRIKFMFPNAYSVYLHDTPARELFHRQTRNFSSGCIRLERPLELAANLLAGTPLDSVGALRRALFDETSHDRHVRLPSPVPVHLVYWTAWVAPDGSVQFRDDIYERDGLLAQALTTPPPMLASR
ncbi:L,D-transpeptidase family protein [Desulfurivibrio alkaliphilus]|uniref:ErfK/YbiS/YcfS/YnhG family protein n=1 Tax=Desulfurivibrio alkaliphilus (strain DSM 19089 / UNIQEM U267 / AHT2) TaxID=589865 RepID=D6Z0L7_DESAT|nr:L,D-transpeptidase family protein [Desulfurivibrio alkaliphilus]ADH85246.1 ErfK/YbiS/YcfS/YnhG family protein [Desulfurivibrio alkaliphilus AHT 2]